MPAASLCCVSHTLSTAGMGPRKNRSLPRALGWGRPLPLMGRGNWVPGPANPTRHDACHITSCEDSHGPRSPSPSLPLTFSPFALLMARRGLSTLSTRRIFTTEMALDLRRKAELSWDDSPAQVSLALPPQAAMEARLGLGVRGKSWQRHADVTKPPPHIRPRDISSWKSSSKFNSYTDLHL